MVSRAASRKPDIPGTCTNQVNGITRGPPHPVPGLRERNIGVAADLQHRAERERRAAQPQQREQPGAAAPPRGGQPGQRPARSAPCHRWAPRPRPARGNWPPGSPVRPNRIARGETANTPRREAPELRVVGGHRPRRDGRRHHRVCAAMATICGPDTTYHRRRRAATPVPPVRPWLPGGGLLVLAAAPAREPRAAMAASALTVTTTAKTDCWSVRRPCAADPRRG